MESYEDKFNAALARGLDHAERIGRGEAHGRPVVWSPPDEVDVAAIRAAQGLTQEQFAAKWGFSLSGLKKWEGKIRQPEAPIRTLLVLIEREPETVERILSSRAKTRQRAAAKKARLTA